MIKVNEDGFILYRKEDNNYIIDYVHVKQRRKGTGSSLVKEIIKEANNKSVITCVKCEDNSITLSELITFFKSLNFKTYIDEGDRMHMIYENTLVED